MKTCFKCSLEFPLSEFYKHPRMPDGHLNKCRECTKKDVRENYALRREQYSAYDRERFKKPERRVASHKHLNEFRARNPLKVRAWNMVARAKRSGKLVAKPCEGCGTSANVQAHHEDYNKPLEVRWLCFACHRGLGHGQYVLDQDGTP